MEGRWKTAGGEVEEVEKGRIRLRRWKGERTGKMRLIMLMRRRVLIDRCVVVGA